MTKPTLKLRVHPDQVRFQGGLIVVDTGLSVEDFKSALAIATSPKLTITVIREPTKGRELNGE